MGQIFKMAAAWGCWSGDIFCIGFGLLGLASGDPFASYYLAAGITSFAGGRILDTTNSKPMVLVGHATIAGAIATSIIPGFIATGGMAALPYIMLAGLLGGRALIAYGTAQRNSVARIIGSAASGLTKVGGAVSLLTINPALAAILLLWTCCDTRTLLNMRTPHYRP